MSILTVPAIVVLLLLAAGLMTWNALLLSHANPGGPLRWSSLPPHRNRSYPVLYGLALVSGMAGMLELRHRVGTWAALVTVMAVLLLPAFVVMRLHNQPNDPRGACNTRALSDPARTLAGRRRRACSGRTRARHQGDGGGCSDAGR